MQTRAAAAVLATLAVLSAAPAAHAQTLAGPAAFAPGTTREWAVFATGETAEGPAGALPGIAAAYRRAGRLNLGARAWLGRESTGGVEVETFGVLPFVGAEVAGLDVRWTAGLGYASGSELGLYLPVGVGVSRAFQVRGVAVTPSLHQRVAVRRLEVWDTAGKLAALADAGVDVALGSRMSLRAGVTAGVLGSTGSTFGVGFAYRR